MFRTCVQNGSKYDSYDAVLSNKRILYLKFPFFYSEDRKPAYAYMKGIRNIICTEAVPRGVYLKSCS